MNEPRKKLGQVLLPTIFNLTAVWVFVCGVVAIFRSLFVADDNQVLLTSLCVLVLVCVQVVYLRRAIDLEWKISPQLSRKLLFSGVILSLLGCYWVARAIHVSMATESVAAWNFAGSLGAIISGMMYSLTILDGVRVQALRDPSGDRQGEQ